MPHELTILCVYYNEAQLHQYLGASLEKQTFRDYELLLVDNSKNAYRNMKDAVDSVRDRVNSAYVMLVHPDISFPENDALSRIVSDCRTGFSEYAILGGAGMAEDKTSISSVVQADGFRPGVKPARITPCFSLDECIVVMPRSIFAAYPLANLGKTWHMYILELCCRLAAEGKKVGVFTPKTVHQSDGARDRSYFRTMLRLAPRYAATFPVIYSTCGAFPTSLVEIYKEFGGSILYLNMQDLKKWALKWMPLSKYLFQFTEMLFHERRERVRRVQEANWRIALEARKKAALENDEDPS